MRALGRHAAAEAKATPQTAGAGPTLAWPVAAFAGLIGGILIGWGAWWGLLFLIAPLLFWARGRGWPLIAVALCAAVLGGVRERAWAQEPDRLAAWHGATVTLGGAWDGQFLTLSDPPARVALSPKPTVAAGELRIRGRLDAPSGKGNPGEFDYGFWLRGQGVREVLYGARVLASHPGGGARAWFRRGLRAGLGAREGALMEAIELGDRREVQNLSAGGDLSVRDAFTRAGVAHVMALSGQNVALLLGVLTFLLARTPLGAWRYGVMLAALVAYLGLVGVSPSILRAVLQGGLLLAALWVGRGKLDAAGALSLAGAISLALYPAWVFDAGFQLSFLAVGGLLLTPHLEARLPARWPRALRLTLAGTLLAEFATAPVVAHNFGQLSLVGLLANVLVAPLMAALVPLGFLAGLLGPLAAPLNFFVGWLAKLLLKLVGALGALPVLPWGQISPAGFAAYAVFALAVVLWLRQKLRTSQLALVSALCVLGAALPSRLFPPREIVYLDVGQGDATLIRLGDFTMLIDGGGTPRSDFDVGARTVVPALRAVGVFDVDVMVATHADADHIEGLAGVLKAIPVGELWIGQRKEGDSVLQNVLEAARGRNVPVREVRRGDQLKVNGATFTTLWPTGAPWREADNENSVVLQLTDKSFKTVFLGDLPDPLESMLGVGKIDVLKTAHHGSRFSTSDAFLSEVSPQGAIISVGRNTYGHPNEEVLQRLAAHHVNVWRTDQNGAVRWPLP